MLAGNGSQATQHVIDRLARVSAVHGIEGLLRIPGRPLDPVLRGLLDLLLEAAFVETRNGCSRADLLGWAGCPTPHHPTTV